MDETYWLVSQFIPLPTTTYNFSFPSVFCIHPKVRPLPFSTLYAKINWRELISHLTRIITKVDI